LLIYRINSKPFVNCPIIPNIFDVHSAIKNFITNIYFERKEDKIPPQNYFLNHVLQYKLLVILSQDVFRFSVNSETAK